MKELELRNIVEKGVKSPSDDFADNLMNEITTLQTDLETTYRWKSRFLFIACGIVAVLSIFVRIPKIHFLNYIIEFSPMITPILSLIFLFIIFQQFSDYRNKKVEIKNNNVVQHAI